MRHELSPVIEAALESLVATASKATGATRAAADPSVSQSLEVVRAAVRCQYRDFLSAPADREPLADIVLVS